MFRRRKRRPPLVPGSVGGYTLSRSRSWQRWLIVLIAACLIVAGVYLAWLLIAPKVPAVAGKSSIDLNTADDVTDNRDRIQIEKINLEVPFYSGGPEELDKGAWHRYPDRGDPEQGGNFILSAHRFDIGTTPAETKKRSPFYNLDKLNEGDTMRIFYKGKWYNYTVTKKYSVKPNAVEIEAPSEASKLTLYSCSLGGSADGRIVIEATTQDGPEKWRQAQPQKPTPTATSSPVSQVPTPGPLARTRPVSPAQSQYFRQLLMKPSGFMRTPPPPAAKPTTQSTPAPTQAEPSAAAEPAPPTTTPIEPSPI